MPSRPRNPETVPSPSTHIRSRPDSIRHISYVCDHPYPIAIRRTELAPSARSELYVNRTASPPPTAATVEPATVSVTDPVVGSTDGAAVPPAGCFATAAGGTGGHAVQ